MLDLPRADPRPVLTAAGSTIESEPGGARPSARTAPGSTAWSRCTPWPPWLRFRTDLGVGWSAGRPCRTWKGALTRTRVRGGLETRETPRGCWALNLPDRGMSERALCHYAVPLYCIPGLRSRGSQLHGAFADPGVDVVDDAPDGVDVLAGGIVDEPVLAVAGADSQLGPEPTARSRSQGRSTSRGHKVGTSPRATVRQRRTGPDCDGRPTCTNGDDQSGLRFSQRIGGRLDSLC